MAASSYQSNTTSDLPMIPRVSLRQSLSDPSLLGNVLSGDSWLPWRVLLIAACGEALDEDERALFKQLTGGREREPGQMCEELIGIVGRRGGKSRAIATLAAWIAGLNSHPALVQGEKGICLIIAPDTTQAGICLQYLTAAFESSPMLKPLIEAKTARELRLTNRISIEVRAADYRRLRGPTFIAVIGDESGFWYSNEDSSNPDSAILDAVRPGLATTRGPLILISSPYARRGVLWDAFRKNYGPDGDPAILVCKGSSRTFNASLPQSVVDRAYERDSASASAEYGGEFRSDLEAFVSREAVLQCTTGLIERPAATSHVTNYKAFADMSGGSVDSSALCIGHYDHARQTVIVDLLRERTSPHSPEQCTEEFARELKRYHINKVISDRYGGAWVTEQYARFNVVCEQSVKAKSDLYIDLLPLLNSRRIELVDNAKMVNQLCNLERRTARSGKDSIDHPSGQHDDLCNAVAGLASLLTEQPFDYLQMCRNFNGTKPGSDPNADWQRYRYNMYLESHGLVRI
jgi:hypothetical protein